MVYVDKKGKLIWKVNTIINYRTILFGDQCDDEQHMDSLDEGIAYNNKF